MLNETSLNLTSLTVRAATHAGALDGCARLINTPAEASGVPALHGHVVALLVTLSPVVADLAASRCCLELAFGLDRRGCGRGCGSGFGSSRIIRN